MSKLTETQMTVLKTIKDAKKATKKEALANAGNNTTLIKLIDIGFVCSLDPTKKLPEVTFAATAEGKAAVKAVEKAAAAAAKAAAKAEEAAAKVGTACCKGSSCDA